MLLFLEVDRLMISVIIPLYNKERYIVCTLLSVLNQTFSDFEIVVVDDGSTDNSVAEVGKIKDSRIRLIHQNNAGVSAARNRGIREAKGDLIAFLDADDEWKAEYLATQYSLSQKYPDCNVFACNYEHRNSDGIIIPTIIRKLPFSCKDGILTNYFQVACYSHPPICSISVMVRRKVIQAIGGFPVGIKSGEDLLTWARLAVRNKIAYCREVLAVYNLGEGYNYTHLPPRRQDANDPVGKALSQLFKAYPRTIGLKHYISHWHKMRASVAIRFGRKKETIKEVMWGLYYNPLNFKLILLLFLSVCPSGIRQKLIWNYHR